MKQPFRLLNFASQADGMAGRWECFAYWAPGLSDFGHFLAVGETAEALRLPLWYLPRSSVVTFLPDSWRNPSAWVRTLHGPRFKM